jgi:hypothetical protein
VSTLCTSCGKPLTPDARFCADCGAVVQRLPSTPDVTGTIHALGTTTDSGPLQPVESPESANLAPGSHVLLVVRGPATGSRIELVGDEMTAGRSPDTAIFLDDITVSRQHATFKRTDSGWRLHDLSSLNGTYVNRDRVDSVDLTKGDEIQIGKYRFHYLVGPDEGDE